MSVKTFNVRPYYDDYDQNKQFYQILFRPSYAIQARELNQMQSILQEQIARHGRNIYKEGAMVVPGQLSIDTNLDYVKLESAYSGSFVDSYVDELIGSEYEVVGVTSGVKAQVVIASKSTSDTPTTIYVKYISSGTDGVTKTFTPGETIVSNHSTPLYAIVKSTSDAVGKASAAFIQDGVYFINSRFVLVKAQSLILDAYSNSPSYRVGLQVSEDFISPEEDDSLYDNAQGSPNFAAPGAHRYFIDLTLSKHTLTDTTDTNFVELLRVNAGQIESKVSKTEYSILEDALARRTYDESGNYAVNGFGIQIRENRSNDRGAWADNTQYFVNDIVTYGGNYYVVDRDGNSGLMPPTHTIGAAEIGTTTMRFVTKPAYNQGVLTQAQGGDSAYMSAMIDPGKAYVYGYEIDKISTTNVPFKKARTYKTVRNSTIQTNVGSYVIVDNHFGFIDTTKFPTVSLRDAYTSTGGNAAGSEIGTAKVRYIEYNSGTIGDSKCQYILSLFDIKMNSGKKFDSNVRQIYFDNASGVDFTCDIYKSRSGISGSFSVTSASAAMTGIGTKFTKELVVGDAIGYYDGSGNFLAPFVVQSITSDTALTLTANASATLSNITPYKAFSTRLQSGNESMLFSLPTKNTRKLRDSNDESVTNIVYYARQSYTGIVSAAGQFTISVATSAETFASPSQPDAFHVVDATDGSVLPATISLNGASSVATITVSTTKNGHTVGVIATVKKTLKERTKTAVRGFSQDFTTQTVAQANNITISKCDGIGMLKVYEYTVSGTPVAFGASIPVNAVAVDITNRYSFDGGQKDAYYGFCSIRNTSGVSPRSPIRVYFDYYEHSTTGDYFSVDSYAKNLDASYIDASGTTLNLFDVVDFRPTMTATGFSASGMPAIGFDITSDYTYYLPRIDKVALSSTGEFVLAEGVPSDSPVAPSTPDNSMLMYTLYVSPSNVASPVVTVTKEDNKRYTMRDIGALDKRLTNVEYYTSLSLLESQTNNLQLFDANGDLYFKNGFIVDSLVDQSVCDASSTEFKASIDGSNGELHPPVYASNVGLMEVAKTASDRKSAGYALKNGIVTLDYSTVTEISQPFATMTESVVPYIQLNFIGDVQLNPSSDEWYDTVYAPDVVINKEGNYTLLQQQYKNQMGTVWGQWQENWTGITWRGRTIMIDAGTATRTGTKTVINAVYSTEVVGDRVITVDLIPFIRSRRVSFVAGGLKANTKLYAYFDSTLVDAYITPAAKITLTNKTGEFDYKTSAGGDSEHIARTLQDGSADTAIGYMTGDIIHNGTGGNIAAATATAVVLLDEDDGVRVANVRGTFTSGQTLYGTISGSTGKFSSITTPSVLMTNTYGEVAGIFKIPSNSTVKFRTGSRLFTLTDSSNNGDDFTTKAVAKYKATGYLSTRQKTIVSTRNGVVAKETVYETISTVPPDPLAQSFKTPAGSGMFVDSVDVYFFGKDRNLPVFLELREMVNGVPTTNVIDGSRVMLKPNQVTTSSNASIATRFTMSHPIYLDAETEYAIVLLSDSPYYTVWVSQLGQNDVITGQRIAKQPYLGTLFKSQNGSTWDASQLQDLKFGINRCKFNVNSNGYVTFNNIKTSNHVLNADAIATKTGSTMLRIFAPNHGIPVGSYAVISGLTQSVNGIAAAQINGSRTVIATQPDYIIVNAGAAATITGTSSLTDTVYINDHVSVDLVQLISTQIDFPETNLSYNAKMIDQSYNMSDWFVLTQNETVALQTSRMIASVENEVAFNGSAKSMQLKAELSTQNEYLSPVLDLTRFSLTGISNRIDTNQQTKAVAGIDDVSTTLTIAFATSGGNSTMTATAGSFSKVKVGQKVSVSGATNAANNGNFVVGDVDSTGAIITIYGYVMTAESKSVTFAYFDKWFDETSFDGTAEAKYVMKPMTLSAPASTMKVLFDVNLPSGSYVDLYYKTATSSSAMSTTYWKKATMPVIQYNDVAGVYSGVEVDITTSAPFSNAQIKIVMSSSNTARTPTIKQIRLIAMS